MVRKLKRVANSWVVILTAFMAVAIFWAMSVFPRATYWFEATSMVIPNAPAGDDVVMIVDREVRREVFGSWTVTVRREGRDGWSLYCLARGDTDYTPVATLPDPLTLDWWTEGQCPALSPGTYFLTTTWAFNPSWMPGARRSHPLVSNAFQILEVE